MTKHNVSLPVGRFNRLLLISIRLHIIVVFHYQSMRTSKQKGKQDLFIDQNMVNISQSEPIDVVFEIQQGVPCL